MTAVEILVRLAALLSSVIFLWKGADAFVDSAIRVAKKFNVSDLVIGLTLVGFGTSAPEFAVSIGAALAGQSDISVANIVGSNIFNLGIILGGCALIRSLPSTRALIHRDGTVLIAAVCVLAYLIQDQVLSRGDGILLAGMLATYLLFVLTRKEGADSVEENEDGDASPKDILFILGGLVAILGGAKLLVWSATEFARAMGMSEWAIGVTIVAAGTSAPELVTSLNAVLKGRFGMGAGNLVGSDLFNTLGVLGAASIITPLAIQPSALSSVYVMVGGVALVVLFLRTGYKIGRIEGGILVLFSLLRWGWEISSATAG